MKRSVSLYSVATCLLASWLVTDCDKSPTTSDHIAGPRFAAAGPVSQLVFTVQPSTAAAGAAITPAVQVTAQDAQGNTVTTYTAKITVALGTNPTNAKLGGTVTVSAKSGVATFANLSITKAATGYALSATSGTLTPGTSSPFDITPGPTSKIMFTVQPTPTAAGDPITPAVQVSAEDGFNNVATPFAGTISLALKSCSAGAILAGTATATAQNGVATFADLSINKSGNCSLKATSGSFTATSATFVIGPAAPASLQFLVQPSKTKAGVAINPTVKVTARDQFGNTASGFNGQVAMSIASGPAGVPLLGTTTVSAVSGTASFTNLIVQKVGAYALQASATGLTAATSNGFLVVPNSPTHLAFTVQPSTAAPGAVITPSVQVTVRDAYDNPVPIIGSVTVAIGSNPGGGTLSGTLTRSAAATGVATFDDLRIDNAGAGYTLVATLGTLPSATSASFDIGITPTRLVFTVQPSNTAAGGTITPAVQVTAQDAAGNTATQFRGNVNIAIGTNPAGGALSGTTSVIAQAGVANFSDLKIDKAGTGYTLLVTSTGLPSSTSAAFDINSSSSVQVLGTLGGCCSDGQAINRNGQVVGGSTLPGDTVTHAYLWDNGTMTDLGTLGGSSSSPTAINEIGQVVGTSQTPGNHYDHAFLWQNGAMIDLGTLGGNTSRAFGINNSGQIVGTSTLPGDAAQHAFLWQNGVMSDLGTLGGSASSALAINDNGDVVGQSETGQSGDFGDISHAFLWQNGQIIDLGTMGGRSQSYATGINSAGQVVGVSYTPPNAGSGFLWQGGTFTDLGSFNGGSTANAINSGGEIVGQNSTVSYTHATLWHNANDAVDLGILGGDVTSGNSYANGLNVKGDVVGTAKNRAVVWLGF